MAWDQDKFEKFRDFMIKENPSVENAIGIMRFTDDWIRYKKTGGKEEEFFQFLSIMKNGGLIK